MIFKIIKELYKIQASEALDYQSNKYFHQHSYYFRFQHYMKKWDDREMQLSSIAIKHCKIKTIEQKAF